MNDKLPVLDALPGGTNYDPEIAAAEARKLLKKLFSEGKLRDGQSVKVLPFLWNDKEVRGFVSEEGLSFKSSEHDGWSGSLCAVNYIVVGDRL